MNVKIYEHQSLTTHLIYLSRSVTSATPLTQLKYDIANIDPEKVDCKQGIDVIDECGLQQGFSYRFLEFAYPTNHTDLLKSCKRQAEALKCLRAYAKCLPAMPKQVLIAMVSSRTKYNKKICSERLTEAASKFLDLGRCMMEDNAAFEKGLEAEINSVSIPETISRTKFDQVQEQLKVSCCSVAEVRQQYMDSTNPSCKQHTGTASEVIDSYLAETVGIVCPNFEKLRNDCAKVPRLTPKAPQHRYFIKPIIDVIQTLN